MVNIIMKSIKPQEILRRYKDALLYNANEAETRHKIIDEVIAGILIIHKILQSDLALSILHYEKLVLRNPAKEFDLSYVSEKLPMPIHL